MAQSSVVTGLGMSNHDKIWGNSRAYCIVRLGVTFTSRQGRTTPACSALGEVQDTRLAEKLLRVLPIFQPTQILQIFGKCDILYISSDQSSSHLQI